MANDVTFQHEEYPNYFERAELVEDVCQSRVKAEGKKYLPMPNPTDDSPANKARYVQYLLRAIFYNVTGVTRRGLVGAAFTKEPTFETPPVLEYAADDIDGQGNGIAQQSRAVLSAVVGTGRHGLLADYPVTSGAVTRAQMESGYIRATSISIDARNIINWRTEKIGGKHKLTLVVYRDDQDELTPDGFGSETVKQYRALMLVQGVYMIALYRKNDKGEWTLHETPTTPKRGNGSTWDEIPFTFVGSENNDPRVDVSPLFDMACVNIGHYRNSADYEDNVFFCGQAQPWASGINQNHYDFLKEEGIYVGARSLFPVPEGGQFGFAQAAPNTQVREAMASKEAQMVAMGARLVQPGGAVKTATEAQQDNETEHSILSLAAENVSQAYTQVLEWMLEFMNGSGEVLYEISQEFTRPSLDAQKITALIGAVTSGQYPESDMWTQFRQAGLIDPEKTDDDIRDELEASAPPALDFNDGTEEPEIDDGAE